MDVTIKSIENEADYKAALEQADALWDAEPGTPDGDRYEALVELIEAYEDIHWPLDEPDTEPEAAQDG